MRWIASLFSHLLANRLGLGDVRPVLLDTVFAIAVVTPDSPLGQDLPTLLTDIDG
jgi:hypothetical protein